VAVRKKKKRPTKEARQSGDSAGWLVVGGAVLVFVLVGVIGIWMVALLIPRLLPADQAGMANGPGVNRPRVVAVPAQPAPDPIAPLKQATVYLRVEDPTPPPPAEPWTWVGTGTVVRSDPDAVYVVTCAHGLVPGLPLAPLGEPARPSIGLPPEGARWNAPRGRILLELPQANADPSWSIGPVTVDPEHDLAILKITGVKTRWPTAPIGSPNPIHQATPGFVLGLPEGAAVGPGLRGPEPEVRSTTIAGVDHGGQYHFQLGDSPPGCEGGPVADASGRLIGIALAADPKTRTRFGVPFQAVSDLLAGGIGACGLLIQGASRKGATTTFHVQLHFPLAQLRSTVFHYAIADTADAIPAAPPNPRPPDEWPGYQRIPGEVVHASLDLHVPSEGRPRRVVAVAIDVATSNEFASAGPDKFVVEFDRVGSYFAPRPGEEPARTLAGSHPPDAFPPRVVTLPAPAGEAVLGGAGRYLLLVLPTARRLAVVDLAAWKIRRELPLPAGAVQLAAGRDKFVFGLLEANVLERWNLSTGDREVATMLPLPLRPNVLALGADTEGPLLAGAALLDLQTLRPLHSPAPPNNLPQYYEQPVRSGECQVRASADGRLLVFMYPKISAVSCYAVNARTLKVPRTRPIRPLRYALPNGDGSAVFTAQGPMSSDLRPLGAATTDRFPCVPALHGPAYLGFRVQGGKPAAALYLLGDERPIAWLPDAFFEALRGADGWPVDPENSIFLLPRAKLLVVVPRERDRLLLYPFDIEHYLMQSSIDYFVVASQPPREVHRGQTLNYRVQMYTRRGGVSYQLGAGPPGMKLAPDGTLTWPVPADFPDKEVTVIVSIREAGGLEKFQTFALAVLPADGKTR
jgi:hypothetical protein